MEELLKTEDLTKRYGRQTVVRGISLSVRKGDIYGFVGKNGAGKTTFLRMVLGLTRPSSGCVELFGGEKRAKAGRRIGSLVESPALFRNMSAKDNLELLCDSLKEDRAQVPEILHTVGLEKTGRKKAGDFSLGMKQRLGLGIALIGNPELLLLDEPINGLDPTGIVEVRQLLLRLQEQGKTIFISSHILGELEKISTRYGIIADGRLVEELTAQELSEKCQSGTELKVSDVARAQEVLSELCTAERVTVGPGNRLLVTGEVEDVGLLTSRLHESGVMVKSIRQTEGDAEGYFIAKMEGKTP